MNTSPASADAIRKERLKEFADTPDNCQRLNLLTAEIKSRVKQAKENIYYLGQALSEAKDIVGHGNFMKYVEEEVQISHSHAENLINVYKHCLGRPEVINAFKLGTLYKITSPGFDKDLREYLFENHENLDEDIDFRTISDIWGRLKKRELTLDSPEVKRLVKFHKKDDAYVEYDEALVAAIEKLREHHESLLNWVKLFSWPHLHDSNKVRLSPLQAKVIDDLFKEMIGALAGIQPVVDPIVKHPPHFRVVPGEGKKEE